MKQSLFTGVCTAMVTPFWEDQIHFPMVKMLLLRQLEAGIRAFVICGTTGESPTLSDEEKCVMFQYGKKVVGNQGLIIAGTGSNSTQHAIQLGRAAQQCGADALLVVSPYYNKATPEGLFAHYAAIAEAVRIPVILYNVPSRTGVDIPVSVYRRLSRIPNIAGVKEASSDITKIQKIIAACGPDFSVWTGNDDMTTAAIAVGARGVISVTSNVLPAQVKAMADAALDGDMDTAAALQLKLRELNEMMFREVNPIPVKAAMSMIGYDCGACRLPLTPLSEQNRKALETLLSDYRSDISRT